VQGSGKEREGKGECRVQGENEREEGRDGETAGLDAVPSGV